MPKSVQAYSAKDEQALMTEFWDPAVKNNPENFVMFAYPWGKANTPLAGHTGPRSWQRDELQAVTQHLADNENRIRQGQLPLMYRSATVSGRGIGKSALTSWLNHWWMTTQLGGTAITTANTESQLTSRTWAELGKWITLGLNAHWFDVSAMSMRPAGWFDTAIKRDLKIDTGYYYAQAQLWSEEKPDAFAGVHNHHGIMVIFDEASGIPQPIWTVTEGFFTEPIPGRAWFCFSNGRRNTGAFFECFHRYRDDWRRRHVDSRTVEGTDPNVYEGIIRKYGEDSDEARVEVKGMFPRQGDKQFISRDVVDEATARELDLDDSWAPLIMGVDVARFGTDKTVIRWRQGRNGRVIPPTKLKGANTVDVAGMVAGLIDKYNPDAVNIDAGQGTGVIDILRDRGYKVNEIWFGHASPEPEFYLMRTLMWGRMKAWLPGAVIDDDQELIDDLSAPEYGFKGDAVALEPKEKTKERGFHSPDDGDALALTFAVKVAHSRLKTARNAGGRRERMAKGLDYDLFS